MSNDAPLRRLQQHYHRWAASAEPSMFLVKEIGQRLLERLSLIKLKPDFILDTSHLFDHQAKNLLTHYPTAQVFENIIDVTQLLTRRCWWQRFEKQAKPLMADPHHLPLAEDSVDLIVSNCLFYGSWDALQLVREWYRVLKPGGLLLFSSLGPDTLKEWRSVEQDMLGMPVKTPFQDMHDIGDSLLRQGFSDPVMDMELLTVYYNTFKVLQRDLRINHFSNDAKPAFHGKTYWPEFDVQYPREPVTNKLPVTCEILYGHAWKLKKMPVESPSEVSISISQIKRRS
ncbi:MAG: methyltransferase domain-containing protein [Gammaproteobacteria bacterium]|nr:methyltransferase domain-containing protein [Gammaproteobacteria bacterium]